MVPFCYLAGIDNCFTAALDPHAVIKVKILCSSRPLSLTQHTISVKSADLQASPHQLMAHRNFHTGASELLYLGCFDQSTVPASSESCFFTQLHLFMLCLTLINVISVVTEAHSALCPVHGRAGR